MGYFSKYRPYYKLPERVSPEIARERRLTALLERDRRMVDVPNFADTLSRVQNKNLNSLSVPNGPLNDRRRPGQKAASIAAAKAALLKVPDKDWTAAHNEQWKAIRHAESAIRAAQSQPSGGDNRRFNPTGKGAATIYGTRARLNVRSKLNWLPVFAHPPSVLPCIQRWVRREVLFATGKGGRGYRSPHRRNSNSGIPC